MELVRDRDLVKTLSASYLARWASRCTRAVMKAYARGFGLAMWKDQRRMAGSSTGLRFPFEQGLAKDIQLAKQALFPQSAKVQ